MKKGWKKKRLEEVCEIARGGSPRPIEKFLTTAPDGINWVKIGDATASDKYIYKTEEKITADGVKRSRMVHAGDFLLSNSMSFGRPYIMKTSGCIHDGWLVLRQREKQLEQDFLYYLLSSDELFQQFDRLAAGSTVRNLNIGLVKSVEISFPPLAEQQRIVGVLDEAFAGLATAEAHAAQNLQNARALFESHLQAVFTQRGPGWVEKSLGDLIEIQNGFAFKSTDYTDAGYFVIRISNVQDGVITLDNPRFIKLGDKKLERFILNAGDILISLTGNIGRVGIIHEEHLPAVLNQRVARITIKGQSADRDFVFRFLCSRIFREGLQQAGHGAAQQNVSTKEIESVRLCLPDKKEQRRIVEEFDRFAEETQRLAGLYERKRAALEALKKSLLHQAFSGNL